MTKHKVLLVLSMLASMTGCATDFTRPAPGKVILGVSHKDEVIKTVGVPPWQDKTIVVNQERVNTIIYFLTQSGGITGTIIPEHSLTYSFFRDVLVGEEYNSTRDGESTEFDRSKVGDIKIGMSKDQIIQLMGKPSGNLLYPLIADKAGSALVYHYNYTRAFPLYSPSWSYALVVTLNDANIVTNISFKEDGKDKVSLK